jgi:hypothetical protein
MPSIAEKLAFSIQEFCALHNISRGHYYALRKAGLGPAEMDAQGRRLISREAAEAWRRAREAAAQAEAAA